MAEDKVKHQQSFFILIIPADDSQSTPGSHPLPMPLRDSQSRELRNSVTRGLVDPSARGIENLYIWKESRVFVNAIYRMMITCKDYGFRDQIQRAAVSIIHFLNIAKGSCGEVKSMLYLCEDFNYCTPEERIALQSQLKRISTGIVRLIDSLSGKSTRPQVHKPLSPRRLVDS